MSLNTEQKRASLHKDGPLLLLACAGAGKCVEENTRLHTSKGYLKIKDLSSYTSTPDIDLKPNQFYDFTESMKVRGGCEADKFYVNGFVDTIRVSSTKFEIEGTPVHPIRVLDKELGVIWKQLQDIKIGDHVCCDSRVDILFNNPTPKPSFLNHLSEIDYGWFVGFFLGDGYIGHTLKGKPSSLSFTKQEQILDYIKDVLVPNILWNKHKDERRDNTYTIAVHSVELVGEFTKLGLSGTSASKVLPEWVYRSNEDFLRGLLSGYLDADGYLGELEIASKSLSLLKGFRDIFNLFGLFPRLIPKVNKQKAKDRLYYRLSFAFIDNEKLKVLDLRVDYKKAALSKIITTNNWNTNNQKVLFTKPYTKELSKIFKEIKNLIPKEKKTAMESFVTEAKKGRRDYFTKYSWNILKSYMTDSLLKGSTLVKDLDNYEFIQVEEVKYCKSRTYDISVPKTSTYTANGVVSHNTKTITSRYIELVKSGVNESNILMLTFTNKAAKEMKERIMLNNPDLQCPYVSTFHSLCARLMRKYVHLLGGFTSSFSIYDDYHQNKLIADIAKEFGVDTKKITTKDIIKQISNNKNRAVLDVSEYTCSEEGLTVEMLIKIASEYKKRMQSANALDFDDLLLAFMYILQKSEKIRTMFQEKWLYVIVDEYQDTNLVQYEILKLICLKHSNLCVTGDVNQCVYSEEPVVTQTISGDIVIKKIGEVKKGDYIRTVRLGTEDFCQVTNVSKSKVNELVSIETQKGYKVKVSTNHRFFGDLKSKISPDKYYILLHYRKDIGYWLSKFKSIKGWDFHRKRRQVGADKIWVLSTADTIEEINMELQHTSMKYNLNVVTSGDINRMNREDFAKINKNASSASVIKLFEDYKLSKDLAISKKIAKTDRNTTTITFNHTGEGGGFKIRYFGSAKRPRMPVMLKMSQVNTEVNKILTANSHAEVRERMQVGDRTFFYPVEALQLEKGFIIPVLEGTDLKPDMVEKAEIIKGDFEVVDIEIATTGLLVTDSIVSHNSIYKFRAADYRIILKFREDFPDAEQIDLSINYRSLPDIVEAANVLIKNNTQRFDTKVVAHRNHKEGSFQMENYYDSYEEADSIVNIIEMLRFDEGYNYKDFCILCRTNSQMMLLENSLTKKRMPYSLSGGLQFFDRKEIKTLVAYINVLNNPRDFVSLKYCINEPKRGIGDTTVLKMIKYVQDEKINLRDYIEANLDSPAGLGLPAKTFQKVSEFFRILIGIDITQPIQNIIQELLDITGLRKQYIEEKEEAESDGVKKDRMVYVNQLLELCSIIETETGSNTIQNFLSYVSLFSNGDDMHSDDKIKVMTIHAAKGLEFPVVFVPGVVEGILPHSRSVTADDIEEERRLMYVALTRAKDLLLVSDVTEVVNFGVMKPATKSRFMKELENDT